METYWIGLNTFVGKLCQAVKEKTEACFWEEKNAQTSISVCTA